MKSIKLIMIDGVQPVAATPTSDDSAFSLIFQDAICINDGKDPKNIIESISIDIQLDVQTDGPTVVSCDLRGALMITSPSCWALASVSAKGKRLLVHSGEMSDVFTAHLSIPVTECGALWISLLALCQRDAADPSAVARVDLDSVDIAFE